MVSVAPYFYTEKLVTLSKLYGIETEYDDFWGKKHQASKEELINILKSMGVVIKTQRDIELAILKFKIRNARKHIKSVYVFNESQKELEICINTKLAEKNEEIWNTLTWNIIFEKGNSISHKIKREDLKIKSESSLNNKTEIGILYLLKAFINVCVFSKEYILSLFHQIPSAYLGIIGGCPVKVK